MEKKIGKEIILQCNKATNIFNDIILLGENLNIEEEKELRKTVGLIMGHTIIDMADCQ